MLEQISLPTHSAIRIVGSKTLWFDPYDLHHEYHDADIVFITHAHYDHFSPDDIRRVANAGTRYLLPASMREDVGRLRVDSELVDFVEPGESIGIEGVSIQAIAAYNLAKPFHPKSNGWVGYTVDLDGTRYYVSGDTDNTPQARDVDCDVALLPVGGTYTMDAAEAADLVKSIRPHYAVPTHYGSVAGTPEDGALFLDKLDDSTTGVLLMGQHRA